MEEEREFARKNKEKFWGYSGTDVDYTAKKYGGFGSDDVKKGSGFDDYSGASYDPYKKSSIFGDDKSKEDESKKKKKKKKTGFYTLH